MSDIASAARPQRGGRIGSVSAKMRANATTSGAWPDSSTRQTGRSRATPRMVPANTLSVPGPLARVSFCTRRRPCKAATGTSCPGQVRPSRSGASPCTRTGGGVAGRQSSPSPACSRSRRQEAGRDGGVLVRASASPSRAKAASGVSCQMVSVARLRSVPHLRTSTAGALSPRGISEAAMAKVRVRTASRCGATGLMPASARMSGSVSSAFRRTTPSSPSDRRSEPTAPPPAGSSLPRARAGRSTGPVW